MSRYLILIYEDDARYAAGGDEAWRKAMIDHQAFSTELGDKILGGEALQPQSTATSIRGDGAGGFTVTDGPFAETKERLGGFYMVEAADLDEAIDALIAEPSLATYPYVAAARADFLRRLGRRDEARSAYGEALMLSDNAVEREFLQRRRDELS